MMYDKQKRLVEHLLKRSRASAIEWQETALDGAFQVSFKDNTVRIQMPETASPTIVVIELINEHGTTVDSFNDEDLDGSTEVTKYFGKMRELYETARRIALGSDRILNEILADLGDDEIPF